MIIQYEVAGERYFKPIEAEELPQMVDELKAHVADDFPELASNPELNVRIVDSLLNGLASNQSEIELPLGDIV